MMRRGRSMAEKCLTEAGSMDTSSEEFHCDRGEQRQPTEGTESRRDFVCFFQRYKNSHMFPDCGDESKRLKSWRKGNNR